MISLVSYPGPAQLSVACTATATESWAGPGYEAMISLCDAAVYEGGSPKPFLGIAVFAHKNAIMRVV